MLLSVLLAIVFAVVQWRLTSALEQRVDNKIIVKMSRSPLLDENFFMRPLTTLESTREFIYWDAVVEGTDNVFWILLQTVPHRILASSNLSQWGKLGSTENIVIPYLPELEAEPVEEPPLPPSSDEISYTRTINVPVVRTLALTTVTSPETGHDVRMGFLGLQKNGLVMVMGISLSENEQLVAGYRRVFATAFVVVLIVASLLGLLIAHGAMAGVKRVTQTASAIEHGDLTQRVTSHGEGEEIHDLTVQFNRMLERIADVMMELKQITSNVAHDLRSPITRIRGLAETTLISNSNNEDYQKMAGAVIEESDSLINMINTMLEIARTDSGIVQFEKQSVDLGELVHTAHDLFDPVAEDMNIRFDVNIQDDHLFVMGDLQRLQRIVANLVDNALKFTPSGETVSLSIIANPNEVSIIVKDTGTGISEDELPRIFDRFYRTDQSRSAGGSGLGLSLVQSLVRVHDGVVNVESSVGEGSVFTIVLPRAYPDARDMESPNA